MDDAEWDRWMELTDAEQEAEIEAANLEYSEWWRTLSPLGQYRRARRSLLDTILKWRGHERMTGWEFLTEERRRCQGHLVTLRAERL